MLTITGLSKACDKPCKAIDVEHQINLAEIFIEQEQIDSAKTLLNNALLCAEKLENKELRAKALLNLGKIEFRKFGPRDVPTRLFLESLALYSELKDTVGIVRCNLQLGVLSFDIRNFEAAVDYFDNIIRTNINDTKLLALAYYLSALSYSELGSFDEADLMFDQTLDNILPSDSVFHLQIQTFTGKMYTNQGDSKHAIEIFNSVLSKFKKTIKLQEYAPVYAFLSRAYLNEGDYKQAIKNARIAYKLSLGKGSNTIYLREAESVLYQAFYAIGRIDSAYYYLEALNVLEDSVSSEQVQQRVTQMSGQYDFEQKLKAQEAEQRLKDKLTEKEIERQKLISNLMFLGVLFVGGFAFVFFRQRTRISREKDRSDKLLLNILPEEIAEELKEKGKAEARNFKQVSILFTDFVQFTETSEMLSPKELVAEINVYFEAFDRIMDEYDIEKIKTIGDAYMAASGLPSPSSDSAKKTVLAALKMQQFIIMRKAKNKELGKPDFNMRVGIHTGPVVAGIVGVKKFQYDIWGDTVNTASRMESHGAPGKVNISDDTYKIIKNESGFSFESRGKIEVKGKGQMQMWFVS